MSFGRSQKVLHQDTQFNPPPGYYDPTLQGVKQAFNSHSFAKQDRFAQKNKLITPGPGAFYDDAKEKIKKRMLQQSKKLQKNFDNNNLSSIKISSIPSIPKKSTTRVYEQLAPGILILHEEQYENTNVGPGSYNATNDHLKKKTVCHKINPEHKKKFIDPADQPPVIPLPTLNDLIREEKRLANKKMPIKASNIQKNVLNPSDLCLQVIILREKLLRGQEVPPPGYYYNPDHQSTFKPKDADKSPQFQLLAGKQERFKSYQKISELGPGAYQNQPIINNQGGFIPKEQRNIVEIGKDKDKQPGPGAYKIQGPQKVRVEPIGNYPPIFGSGCARFTFLAKPNDNPGPASYSVNGKKKKKVKYIKIRKDFTQEKIQQQRPVDLFEINPKDYRSQSGNRRGYASKPKYTSSFSSKVERFGRNNLDVSVGPQNYNPYDSSVIRQSSNRSPLGYVGPRDIRFHEEYVRPTVGPGSYQTVKQKKIQNVIL